jgi:hypothetical protein
VFKGAESSGEGSYLLGKMAVTPIHRGMTLKRLPAPATEDSMGSRTEWPLEPPGTEPSEYQADSQVHSLSSLELPLLQVPLGKGTSAAAQVMPTLHTHLPLSPRLGTGAPEVQRTVLGGAGFCDGERW